MRGAFSEGAMAGVGFSGAGSPGRLLDITAGGAYHADGFHPIKRVSP